MKQYLIFFAALLSATIVGLIGYEWYKTNAAKQDQGYREMVIGRGTARVSVEAATKLGWERFVGEDGGIIGMESFGASGAVAAVFEKFGITAANVVKEVEARLSF